ncbi:MAG: AAA family ATPase [Chloroflexi bacterium]|nr:AAA family ATPase [Chloroflexota bacterium]
MTCTIAVAGKGGSGKTSITSLIIRYLKKNDSGLILAVDADANANLADSLGLEVSQTLGSLIASFNVEKINIPAGFTKEAYLEYKLNEAVVESNRLDLVTMGRGEGPECYCYPNSILRKFLDTMSDNYAYVVMDNEAGLEHLSRRTTQNVDELLLVSDHSVKGVRTLARIKDLVSELGLAVKRQSVIINFVADGLDPAVAEEMNRLGLTPTTTVPFDEEVRQCDLQQKPLLDLPDTSRAVATVNELMTRLLKGG